VRKVDIPRVGAYVTHSYWNANMHDRRHMVVGLVSEVYPDHNVLRTKPASGRGHGSWDPIRHPRTWFSPVPQWYELDRLISPPTGQRIDPHQIAADPTKDTP
jgi:hypothetical protein